jgi:hypothetical protein
MLQQKEAQFILIYVKKTGETFLPYYIDLRMRHHWARRSLTAAWYEQF